MLDFITRSLPKSVLVLLQDHKGDQQTSGWMPQEAWEHAPLLDMRCTWLLAVINRRQLNLRNKHELLLNNLLGCIFNPADLRHQKSWEVVREHVDGNFKVWSLGLEDQMLPTLLPWIDGQMENLTYTRETNEEAHVLYVCLPTCGVVPAKKNNYFLTLVTSFLSARPTNSIAIFVHANRAGDGGKKQTTFHTQCMVTK